MYHQKKKGEGNHEICCDKRWERKGAAMMGDFFHFQIIIQPLLELGKLC